MINSYDIAILSEKVAALENAEHDSQTASAIEYDNTGSGLTADDVQEAIDELAERGANSISYDNTSSGLTATETQSALDEIVEKLNNVYNPISVFASTETKAYLSSDEVYAISEEARNILSSGKYIAQISFNSSSSGSSAGSVTSFCKIGSHGLAFSDRSNPATSLFAYRFNLGTDGISVTIYGTQTPIYIFNVTIYAIE